MSLDWNELEDYLAFLSSEMKQGPGEISEDLRKLSEDLWYASRGLAEINDPDRDDVFTLVPFEHALSVLMSTLKTPEVTLSDDDKAKIRKMVLDLTRMVTH